MQIVSNRPTRAGVAGAATDPHAAARSVETDAAGDPIDCADIGDHFAAFEDGKYVPKRRGN